MKRITILFAFLTFAHFSGFSQTAKLINYSSRHTSFKDSLVILKNCNYERANINYRWKDGNQYQVFLDVETLEVFLIMRNSKRKFEKVIIDKY